MENWKDILGYEGLYQVSDLGRVRSIKNNIILKQTIARGRYRIMLCKRNHKQFYVHRLVWETFNHQTDLQIDHIIEGNKLDNRLCNLQPLTASENMSKYLSHKIGSNKYTGVCYKIKSRKWIAVAFHGKNRKYIGSFDSQELAIQARQNIHNQFKQLT